MLKQMLHQVLKQNPSKGQAKSKQRQIQISSARLPALEMRGEDSHPFVTLVTRRERETSENTQPRTVRDAWMAGGIR